MLNAHVRKQTNEEDDKIDETKQGDEDADAIIAALEALSLPMPPSGNWTDACFDTIETLCAPVAVCGWLLAVLSDDVALAEAATQVCQILSFLFTCVICKRHE